MLVVIQAVQTSRTLYLGGTTGPVKDMTPASSTRSDAATPTRCCGSPGSPMLVGIAAFWIGFSRAADRRRAAHPRGGRGRRAGRRPRRRRGVEADVVAARMSHLLRERRSRQICAQRGHPARLPGIGRWRHPGGVGSRLGQQCRSATTTQICRSPPSSSSSAHRTRFVAWDKRGTGQSDPVTRVPPLDERMDDLHAVMDAAGAECPALFGVSEGGPMSILFAATYPERVRSLVLYGTMPRFIARAARLSLGYPPDQAGRIPGGDRKPLG